MTKYRNYMEFQKLFLVIEDLNLCQGLWKSLQRHWELNRFY